MAVNFMTRNAHTVHKLIAFGPQTFRYKNIENAVVRNDYWEAYECHLRAVSPGAGVLEYTWSGVSSP
jgi:hypothetical protein